MNIGIVGLGLIGGSLGRALVKNTKHKIYAYDENYAAMIEGEKLKAYHETLTIFNTKELDLLIFALYPKAMIDCILQYIPLMKSGAIVVDCAGTKRKIVKRMRAIQVHQSRLHYIGAHPMAGREFSGIKHSKETLFEKASILFVPLDTPDAVIAKVKKVFLQAGAERIVITTAEEHDKMIAYTSQLAHVVSSAYVNNKSAAKHRGFTAGSFHDMTRVAKLNSEMWSELMVENSDYLTKELDVLIKNLKDFRGAISGKDKAKLKDLLEKGNEIKMKIV